MEGAKSSADLWPERAKERQKKGIEGQKLGKLTRREREHTFIY